ncbi:MAG: flavin reductase family protein [Candidatus Helarchaeota archaeon]
MTKSQVPIAHAFRLAYPKIVCLITAADPSKENGNIITLAWTTAISFNPAIYGVSIAIKQHSNKLIKQSGEFAVNLPTMEILDKVLYCGRNSGRNIDKFKETGLTPIPAKKIQVKLIEECITNFECKVIDAQEYGDHTFFVGKVVEAQVSDGVYDKTKKRLDIEHLGLVYHCGGDLFCTNKNEVITPKK